MNIKTALEKHIVSMATRIAHDIRAPIQIIENLIKNSENSLPLSKNNLLSKLIASVYIAKSVLTENKKVIADNSYGVQSLYCIAADLIADKNIEWGLDADVAIIDLVYNTSQIIWLSNEQAKIKSVISNLLNNAHEASDSNAPNIKFSIDLQEQNVIISIQDFGCGIDASNLLDIKNGKSLKVSGNGIGLSSAYQFMQSINGTLKIDSIVNQGTTITLVFPQLTFPEQFATQLMLTTNHS